MKGKNMKKLVYCTIFIALFFASIYDVDGMKRKADGDTINSVTNETMMPINTDESDVHPFKDEGGVKKKRRTEENSSSQVDPIAAETASNSLPPPSVGSSTDDESEEDEYPTFIDAMGSSAFLFPFEPDNDNDF